MEVIPYLYFNGNANEALDLYKIVFDSEPSIMRYKDQPSPDLKEEYKEMVLHAELKTIGGIFYISDSVGVNEVKIGNNIQININCDSEHELRRIFKLLSEGGLVDMELQDTFWGAIYGSLTDKFGVSWSMNYQKEVQPV